MFVRPVTLTLLCQCSPWCCVSHPHGLGPRAEPPVQEAFLRLPPPANAHDIIAIWHQLQRGFITQKRVSQLIIRVPRSSSWLGHQLGMQRGHSAVLRRRPGRRAVE